MTKKEIANNGAWKTPPYPDPLPSMIAPKVIPGLDNLGNTCYLNASLQCILKNPNLGAYLYKFVDHSACEQERDDPLCARCELGMFAKEFLKAASEVLRPEVLVNNIQEMCDLDSYRQQDAAEFLIKLIMEIAISENEQIGVSDPEAQEALENAPISRIVGGATATEVTCTECEISRSVVEHFSVLIATIQNEQTATEALAEYVKQEPLTDKADCDHCQRRTKSLKRVYIRRAPNVLLLALPPQVDGFSAKTQVASKAADPIFLESLDLDPYMKHPDNKNSNISYTLTGVIVHKGATAKSGHYVAYIKNRDGTNWIRKDDDDSLTMPFSRVKRQRPYILFYQRDKDVDESTSSGMSTGAAARLERRREYKEKREQRRLRRQSEREGANLKIGQSSSSSKTKTQKLKPETDKAQDRFPNTKPEKLSVVLETLGHLEPVVDTDDSTSRSFVPARPSKFLRHKKALRMHPNPKPSGSLDVKPSIRCRSVPSSIASGSDGREGSPSCESVELGPDDMLRYREELPVVSSPLVVSREGSPVSPEGSQLGPDADLDDDVPLLQLLRTGTELANPELVEHHVSLVDPSCIYWKPGTSESERMKYSPPKPPIPPSERVVAEEDGILKYLSEHQRSMYDSDRVYKPLRKKSRAPRGK